MAAQRLYWVREQISLRGADSKTPRCNGRAWRKHGANSGNLGGMAFISLDAMTCGFNVASALRDTTRQQLMRVC
jgi:hypothetical protein